MREYSRPKKPLDSCKSGDTKSLKIWQSSARKKVSENDEVCLCGGHVTKKKRKKIINNKLQRKKKKKKKEELLGLELVQTHDVIWVVPDSLAVPE